MRNQNGRWNPALLLLDLAFMLTLILVPVAWTLNPLSIAMGSFHVTLHGGFVMWLLPLGLLLARTGLKRVLAGNLKTVRGLWEASVFKKLALAVIATHLMFDVFEHALIFAGYKGESPPIVIKGDNNVSVSEDRRVIYDPEVLWRFVPGSSWYKQTINSLGYRDREINREKPPGTIRIIAMGDSCTAQGNPSYTQALHKKLTEQPLTGQPWEAFNMAVYGYSSMQGLKIFEKETCGLHPDIVTLYFGWNDHWTYEIPDRTRLAVAVDASPGARLYKKLIHNKKFFVFMVDTMQGRQHKPASNNESVRVSPEEYRATLNQFIKDIRGCGAIPLLITAPRRSLTEGLVTTRHAHSVAEAEVLHDQYVEITREVARENKTLLLDLAEKFKGPECDGYFMDDGIHFKQDGLERIANELYETLRQATPALSGKS